MPIRPRPLYYRLSEDGRTPEPVADVLEWGAWMTAHDAECRVALTEGEGMEGFERVSTVFLGLDHNYSSQGPALLFETMVFGGARDEAMRRYATWEDAAAGHEVMLALIRALTTEPMAE